MLYMQGATQRLCWLNNRLKSSCGLDSSCAIRQKLIADKLYAPSNLALDRQKQSAVRNSFGKGHIRIVLLKRCKAGTCCNKTAILRSASLMPLAFRLSQARSFHFDAQTPQIACQARCQAGEVLSHSPDLMRPASDATAATYTYQIQGSKSEASTSHFIGTTDCDHYLREVCETAFRGCSNPSLGAHIIRSR